MAALININFSKSKAGRYDLPQETKGGTQMKQISPVKKQSRSLMVFILLALFFIEPACAVDRSEPKAEKTDALRGLISDLEDQSSHLSSTKDLMRIVHHYDRLEKAYEKIGMTNASLDKVFKNQEFAACSHVIVGAGDSGTSLWLEKYKPHHGKTQAKLDQGQLPDVLMIGETLGNWKHDYTLAQPYNLLERGISASNPSDFLFFPYYNTNPYANARHVFQANLVSLALTDAPHLAGIKMLRIEKKNQHSADWKSKDHDYRVITLIPAVEKAVYTNAIDICTGLGHARNGIAEKCSDLIDFEDLSQFDQNKKFTPIIDGDQFILTDTEEKSPESRTIVIYGGGGTAAACYRKGFFGNDRKTEPRPFENQKNKVIWVAKNGFKSAGGGKLATKALAAAKKRNELFTAELREITLSPKKEKLKLSFTPFHKTTEASDLLSEIECDQFIYALGQEDIDLAQACEELNLELELDINKTGMPLGVKTKDEKIHFFGAAAMAIRQQDYISATWKWLHEENIGPDVGPGSMPPSRAQIKQYISEIGLPIECVNVNIDNSHLIQQFLKQSGIEPEKIPFFMIDILQARKDSTSGCTTTTLQNLLDKHAINSKVQILGLTHLTGTASKIQPTDPQSFTAQSLVAQ